MWSRTNISSLEGKHTIQGIEQSEERMVKPEAQVDPVAIHQTRCW